MKSVPAKTGELFCLVWREDGERKYGEPVSYVRALAWKNDAERQGRKVWLEAAQI